MKHMIVILLLATIFVFGCITGGPTDLKGALAIARSDPTKFVFELSAGAPERQLNGTIHLLSDTGKKSLYVPGYLLMNKSEVCDGEEELYSTLLVTFNDSPVGETWSWGKTEYCDSYSFNPWVNDSDMERIRHPRNPELTKALAEGLIDPRKFVFALTVEYWGDPLSGTVYFFSANDTKKYRVQTAAIIDKADVCEGVAEKYKTIYVMFDDSPANETWTWTDQQYCDSNSYNIWINKEQRGGIENPKNPARTRAFAEATLDPTKMVFYFDMEGEPFSGTLNFSRGAKSYVIDVPGVTIVNRSDICDHANKEIYNVTELAFADSPIGEAWTWTDLIFCQENRLHPFNVNKSRMDEIKNPRMEFYFFERADKGGNPLDGDLYCGNYSVGELKNGHANASRVDLLKATGGGNCSLSIFGDYDGIPYEFCGWILDVSYVRKYGEYSSYLALNSTELQLRRAPCSTGKSFVTPDDPTVKRMLDRYLPGRTRSAYGDINTIFDRLSDDYEYVTDEDMFGQDDWIQLPSEFFRTIRGDCEDWSVAFLSLVLAREATPCYAVGVNYYLANGSLGEGAHVTVLCILNDAAMIFDQHQTYSGRWMWDDLRRSLDYKGELTRDGITTVKPRGYFNNTFYAEVKDAQDLYRKLGVTVR